MKASELRIGNWWTNGENNYVMDISTMQDMVIALEDGFTDLYQPIPLTPEWLKRFGLVRTEDGNPDHYSLGDIAGAYFENIHVFELFFYEHAPCQYVHQLQNLYFALTGEELELKENAIQ